MKVFPRVVSPAFLPAWLRAGDGIAGRGPAYGIATLRVDGGDARAVYNATAEARRIALEQQASCVARKMLHRGLNLAAHGWRCPIVLHKPVLRPGQVLTLCKLVHASAPAGAGAARGDELPQRPPLHVRRQLTVRAACPLSFGSACSALNSARSCQSFAVKRQRVVPCTLA